MPKLTRTLNQIIRKERKDVYFVRFARNHIWSIKHTLTRQRLLLWLQQNLPGTRIDPICPEDNLEGVNMQRADLRIDFDEPGLAKFRSTWENSNRPNFDPYFHFCVETFADWRAKIPCCMPSFHQPLIARACWLWDTPKGFLHYPIPHYPFENYALADPEDVWFLAGELVPEWQDADIADFVGGCIYYNSSMSSWAVCIGFLSPKNSDYSRNDKYLHKLENQQRIQKWFALPDGVVFEKWRTE